MLYHIILTNELENKCIYILINPGNKCNHLKYILKTSLKSSSLQKSHNYNS